MQGQRNTATTTGITPVPRRHQHQQQQQRVGANCWNVVMV